MHVMFVCHGNICRSAMAERVARQMAEQRGLDIEISSTGISDEEHGNPIDYRARRLLTECGYDADGHSARQLTRQLAQGVDLFVAAERHQADRIVALGVDPSRVKLVSDYDPQAEPGDPLPDPWFGGRNDFERTLAALERAIPKILTQQA